MTTRIDCDRFFYPEYFASRQLTNLNELGYLTMTPVQAAALPAILAGKDVRVQAKTGSGKTAAFGLGLLQQLMRRYFKSRL